MVTEIVIVLIPKCFKGLILLNLDRYGCIKVQIEAEKARNTKGGTEPTNSIAKRLWKNLTVKSFSLTVLSQAKLDSLLYTL